MNRTNELPRATRWLSLIPGALLALALQSPALVQAKCQLKAIDLPVKIVGTRAIATVDINGTKVPLLVDSGAAFSTLTDATAAQLNLSMHALPVDFHVTGLLGRVQARLTTVDHLKLGNGDLPDMDFIVGGNELDGGAMGLLGRNIIAAFDTEYDLAHGMIRLVKPNDECANTNMAYWAGKAPVSVVKMLLRRPENSTSINQVKTEAEFAPEIQADVLLNEHRVTATFDSGATTTVSLDAAHAAGVKDEDMKARGAMIGAGRGKTAAWTASFDSVELGGESVRNNRLLVADFNSNDEHMLLGSDFFLSHHIYVAQKQARIYFTYNGGPVFALNVDAPKAAAPDAAVAQAGDDKLTADELARRGAASLTRGDLAAALSDLDRACAMEPGNAGFLATRAAVHQARKERDAALADLDAALRLDPGLADARLRRASMHRGKDERDLALADLAALDKSLPPQANLRASLGQLYIELGMPAQALSQWTQWIDAHPHDVGLEHAYNGRCRARFELGIELDKALDDCGEAVGADSKNPVYASNRGWVYLRLGKPQKALADFDQALAIKPGLAWPLYGRGQAHLGLGQTALAQADLAAARQAQPDIDAMVQRTGMPTAAQ